MTAMLKKGSLGIRGRLFLGFVALVIPILCITTIFLFKLENIEDFMKRRSQVVAPMQLLTSKMDAQVYETQLLVYGWLLTESSEKKALFSRVWSSIKDTQTKLNALIPQNNNAEIHKRWEALTALYPKLLEIQNKLMAEKVSNPNNAIKQIINQEARPTIDKMLELLEGSLSVSQEREGGIFALQTNELSKGSEEIIQDMDTLRAITYALLLITIVLAVGIAFFTAKKIIEPIRSYSQHSSKIASGDLTQRISVESSDELGTLGQDLNTMTDGLAAISKQITEASQKMTSLLEEVKQAGEMQSTGVAEQASSINEITASLEEIDKSATQTMEKAKILGQISEQTSQKGKKGLDAVQQSIAGMKLIHDKVQTIATTILELSNQTQQISEITTVVNTLALQSKMLALNASIEAAKAGEAGKGFAVVASEVKNLAEQSEQSTTQVQKILEDIRHGTERAVIVTEEGAKGVAEGTGVVEQMGEIMQSLTEAINETMLASQQIEVAVRQESLGIEQITVGMNEINQVTASFVNTVQQTTELISNLGDMAKLIKNSVDKYKL